MSRTERRQRCFSGDSSGCRCGCRRQPWCCWSSFCAPDCRRLRRTLGPLPVSWIGPPVPGIGDRSRGVDRHRVVGRGRDRFQHLCKVQRWRSRFGAAPSTCCVRRGRNMFRHWKTFFRQTRVLQFCTFGPSTRSHSSSLWAREGSAPTLGQELSRRGRGRRSEDRTYSRGVLGAGAERIDRAIGRARQSGRLSCASRRVVPLRQARRVEDALLRAGAACRQHHRRSQQVGQPALGVRAPAQPRVAGKFFVLTRRRKDRASNGPFGECYGG